MGLLTKRRNLLNLAHMTTEHGYIIEKNVPLPDMTGKKHVSVRSGGSLRVAISAMEVGDSLMTKKTLQAISFAALTAGVDVTSRKEGDFYRVWRTS